MNAAPRKKALVERVQTGNNPLRLDLANSIKFAAIDIGSNAIRLVLARVFEDGDQTLVEKESLIRMPIRLGEDAFIRNRIGDEKADRLATVMQGFRSLIDAYQPEAFMACATSAMREAKNAGPIIERIREQSGIDIRVIDGQEEARIIFSNHRAKTLSAHESSLYVDVGGGSCDLTLISPDQHTIHQSYRIGTVRFIEGLIAESEWKALKNWLRQISREHQPASAIGSGGNINAVFQLARQKAGRPLGVRKFSRIHQQIEAYSFEERIQILGLKPDRADVIGPACRIYLAVMHWAGIRQIFAPQVGLADGLIHILYERYRQRK